MNKTEIKKQIVADHKRTLATLKWLPAGRTADYSCVSGDTVHMSAVKTFKDYLWQLARFDTDSELNNYNVYSGFISLCHRVPVEGEIDEWGDQRYVRVYFSVEDIQGVIDGLGIKCEIREETRSYTTKNLVCMGD